VQRPDFKISRIIDIEYTTVYYLSAMAFALGRIVFAALLVCVLAVAATANKKPPAAPVNLNAATSEELQLVPGIGPATAEKILQMRKAYGPFKSVDDLLAIRGIGPKRLEKMRKYLTVGKPSSTSKPAAAKPTSPTKPNGAPKTPSTSADPPCLPRLAAHLLP
jgi:competence protein ComEA